MPYMQRRRLTSISDLNDHATWRYKFPTTGLFTGFELVVQAPRLADPTDNEKAIDIAEECTKIEMLKGGSQAIISLTGRQLDALNYWDFKRPNARRYRQQAAKDNIMFFYLMGGRDLWDREYGFDMRKLGETYIELTHDMIADVTEGFDCSESTLELYAHQWMGANLPSFKGYFRSRQLGYWTCAGSGIVKTIPIPVGNPIRRVAFQAATRAQTIGGTATALELVVNDGEYSPVHIKSPMRYVMQEVSEYGLENELGGIGYIFEYSAHDVPQWFSYYQDGSTCGHTNADVLPHISALIQQPFRLGPNTTSYGEVVFKCKGWGFQKCLRMGFDHERDGFDLLPTRGLGALDLVVTEAGSSRDARVFVQDVISY